MTDMFVEVGQPAEPTNGDELRQFIERIERLEEEKAGVAEDVREVYTELKGRGYDAKVVRKIIAERKKDPAQRQEETSLFETYKAALGMI